MYSVTVLCIVWQTFFTTSRNDANLVFFCSDPTSAFSSSQTCFTVLHRVSSCRSRFLATHHSTRHCTKLYWHHAHITGTQFTITLQWTNALFQRNKVPHFLKLHVGNLVLTLTFLVLRTTLRQYSRIYISFFVCLFKKKQLKILRLFMLQANMSHFINIKHLQAFS